MKLYTGNYANVQKYIAKGIHTIGISISARYYKGDKMPELAPMRSMLNMNEKQYVKEYDKILSKLNPMTVAKKIEKLSNGSDAILLCHEKAGDFCHRRLVAEWFEKKFNTTVKELGRIEPKQKQLLLFNADKV